MSEGHLTLAQFLERFSDADPAAGPIVAAVNAIAEACVEISYLACNGPQSDTLGTIRGANAGGDLQKEVDISADDIIRRALARAPIAVLASEEAPDPVVLDPSSTICVAIDPLDGSSNIETNTSVGTIFSIVPAPDDLSTAYKQRGSAQLAAGVVVYGPQTSLVLTLGQGVDIFALDRTRGVFRLLHRGMEVPARAAEFAVNASNQRYWDVAVKAFIDECLAGNDGALARDYNMRWTGSLVAEAYRILVRGGIFLYPADARAGYENGRLRLVYEAHPMAFIIEQAGGVASTGYDRVMDLSADSLHERVALVMGSADDVARLEHLYAQPEIAREMNAPLFGHRGLFRV